MTDLQWLGLIVVAAYVPALAVLFGFTERFFNGVADLVAWAGRGRAASRGRGTEKPVVPEGDVVPEKRDRLEDKEV